MSSGISFCVPLVRQGLWGRVPCAEPSRDEGSVSTDERGRPIWDPVCAKGWYHGPCWHLHHPHQGSSSSRSSGTHHYQFWVFALSPPPFPPNPETWNRLHPWPDLWPWACWNLSALGSILSRHLHSHPLHSRIPLCHRGNLWVHSYHFVFICPRLHLR